jgi:hypothetical protein
MNEFLIDCPFKQYSMALKFDLLIHCYAIFLSRAMWHSAGSWSRAMRHSVGLTYKFYTKNLLRYAA